MSTGGTRGALAHATVWLDSPALPELVVARLRDDHRPIAYDDQDRAVLFVSATLEVAGERVALVEETYLEPVLW